ncbi:TPA: hypothetical protein JHJ70_003597 [Serratia marcescens]|nr:hypothetical protein [Serratia marcescens]
MPDLHQGGSKVILDKEGKFLSSLKVNENDGGKGSVITVINEILLYRFTVSSTLSGQPERALEFNGVGVFSLGIL